MATTTFGPADLDAPFDVVIIGGGIAAYKSLELIRRLGDHGCRVRCILTKAGAAFVTPLSLAALSGDIVLNMGADAAAHAASAGTQTASGQ